MGRIFNVVTRVMPAGSLGTFPDGQLAGLAQHIKKKGIDLDYNTKSPGDWPGICEPIAVSVIAIGGRIYVASNFKGGKYNISRKSPSGSPPGSSGNLKHQVPSHNCQLW